MTNTILTLVLAAGLPAFTTLAQSAEDSQKPQAPAAAQKADRDRPDDSRDANREAGAPRNERREQDMDREGGDRSQGSAQRGEDTPLTRHPDARPGPDGRGERPDFRGFEDRRDFRGGEDRREVGANADRRELRGGQDRPDFQGRQGRNGERPEFAQGPRHQRNEEGFAPRRGYDREDREFAQRGEGRPSRNHLAAAVLKALDLNHDGVLDEREIARALDVLAGLNARGERGIPFGKLEVPTREERHAAADRPQHRPGRMIDAEESFGAPRHQHPVENGTPNHSVRGDHESLHADLGPTQNNPAEDAPIEPLPPMADVR